VFGGQYAPGALTTCFVELDAGFEAARKNPAFWEEYESYYPYICRPSSLHQAQRLSEYAGGANIWLKREDLNHTGSPKINNALGQILVARRLGKTEIIAETGAGQQTKAQLGELGARMPLLPVLEVALTPSVCSTRFLKILRSS
jgi:tryptophan synthase